MEEKRLILMKSGRYEKYLLVLLLSFFVASCAKKQVHYLSKDELIEIIAKEDDEQSRQLDHVFLFCETTNGEIGVIDGWGLIKNYSITGNMSYCEYVINIFNNRVSNCKDLYSCFNLDPSVCDEYYANDVNYLLDKYTTDISDGEYVMGHNLGVEKRLTVLYFLFKQGYFTEYDDYTGFYYIQRMPHDYRMNVKIDTLIPLDMNLFRD